MRFGLVMNGGVSLAVWIGGVTTELDRLRLASEQLWSPGGPAPGEPRPVRSTMRLYGELLHALDQSVVVDVIAGASAGGINGILLGAAIANGKEMPNLRETWISVGDFRNLLRSPSEKDPPSVMKGDDVVLPELQARLELVFRHPQEPRQSFLYLYVTATDLRGYPREWRDSTGRAFDEYDYRRSLAFQFEQVDNDEQRVAPSPITTPSEPSLRFPSRPIELRDDPEAWQLLAEAARSTSSFPVAFEPHAVTFDDADGEQRKHFLIDGGVLDNQPFNPVLDRLPLLPGQGAARRVVAYIVPYVNEPGSLALAADASPERPTTTKELISASGGLPRELPKLQSLDRVTQQRLDQFRADEDRKRMWQLGASQLAAAAAGLLPLYRETRLWESYLLFGQWASPGFRPGDGVYAQDPSVVPEQPFRFDTSSDSSLANPGDVPWIPAGASWAGSTWEWGLAPAERVASWALLFIRDALDATPDNDPRIEDLNGAQELAARLNRYTRKTKPVLLEVFRGLDAVEKSMDQQKKELLEHEEDRRDLRPTNWNLRAWATDAFRSDPVVQRLKAIQDMFEELDVRMRRLPGLPTVGDLLNMEVVQNSDSVNTPSVPFPFDFLFMSAGVENSLLHRAREPKNKLAGIKLNHFAGFLKRSWRANDWLWGRMDGVEHVLRALLDVQAVGGLDEAQRTKLAALAFPPEPEPGAAMLADIWEVGSTPDKARDAFIACLERTRSLVERVGDAATVLPDFVPETTGTEAETVVRPAAAPETVQALEFARRRGEYFARREVERCRRALAARIQLELLLERDDELSRIAQTVGEDISGGASKISNGALWRSRYEGAVEASGGFLEAEQRVDLWRELNIGEEEPKAEASSRLVLDVGAQAVAVAAALAAGNRAGLPLFVRSTLATVRGLTLAAGAVVQLLARTPWVGAAVVAALAALTIWAFADGGAFFGTLAPAMAVAVVVGSVVLITIAINSFEEPKTTVPGVLAFALLVGVPVAFGLTAGWPGIAVFHNWLDGRLNGDVAYVATVVAWCAAALAVGRFVVGGISDWPAWARIILWVVCGGLVAFGVTALTVGSWLHDGLGDWGDVLAACLFGVAVAIVARLVFESVWRAPAAWRHGTLSFYRSAVLAGLSILLIGFFVQRWRADQLSDVASRHKGIVIVGTLLAIFGLTAILMEVVTPWLHRRRQRSPS